VCAWPGGDGFVALGYGLRRTRKVLTAEQTHTRESTSLLVGASGFAWFWSRREHRGLCLGLIFMNLGRGPGHTGPSAMQHEKHNDVFEAQSGYYFCLLISTLEDGYAHR
jgi:hypothetical protein